MPLFFVPHAQVHSPAGAGLPQFEQNLPVFFAPQLHVHSFALTGAGLPQFAQNLPMLPVCPQEQVQPAAAGAACACACAPRLRLRPRLRPRPARMATSSASSSAARGIMERKTWFLYEMIYLLFSPPRPDAERKDGDLP